MNTDVEPRVETEPNVTADVVLRSIGSWYFNYATEDTLQEGLFKALQSDGFEVEREVRLNDRDRIDLVVAGSIGIEVKVSGTAADVARQLDRYAECPVLSELILVSSRSKHGIACNPERRIPTAFYCLSRASL